MPLAIRERSRIVRDAVSFRHKFGFVRKVDVLRVVKAVVITAVVMVIAVLPPLIHFVTGPISPAIGGYVAGSKLRLSGREAVLLGVVLALVAGIPAYFGLQRFSSVSPGADVVIAIAASLYAGGLSAFAAWFASSSDEGEKSEDGKKSKGSGFTFASDD